MGRGIGVTVALRELLPEWTETLFAAIAMAGDLAIIVPILGVLYLADVWGSLRSGDGEIGRLCSDRTVFLIATVFGGLALIVLLKAAFGLPRPPAELHAITPSEHGFPSGHTMAATVFWGAMAAWTSVGRRRHRIAIAAVIVGFVGFSRLGLGVHYLVDVVASVGFGLGYLAAVAAVANDSPERAFAVAVAVALLALVVSGAETRAILAAGGTVGAFIGWQLVEHPAVSKRLVAAVGRP